MPNVTNTNTNTGVREYIGARYVPLIDGEWDNTKAYEPLTVVINQGDSYTSKQYVPVGVEISNSEYWVLTGNFNGSLANLITTVDTIKEEQTSQDEEIASLQTAQSNTATDIANIKEEQTSQDEEIASLQTAQSNTATALSNLENSQKQLNNPIRKMLWLGDSYSDPATAAIDWVQIYMKPLLNATQIINNSVSGATIATSSSNNIAQQIPSTPLEGITDVMLYAGHNDQAQGVSSNNLKNALKTILNTLTMQYPDAKIHLFIPNTTDQQYSNIAGYITAVHNAIMETKLPNVFAYDYVYLYQQFYGGRKSTNDGHPTATGLAQIAQHVASCIQGNEPTLQTILVPTTNPVGLNNLQIQMTNNHLSIQKQQNVTASNSIPAGGVLVTYPENTLITQQVLFPVFQYINNQPRETKFFRLRNSSNGNYVELTTIDGVMAGDIFNIPTFAIEC